MKTTRILLLLLSGFLCLSTASMAQSNAKPGYDYAHKNAENYQKHLQKQRRKQEKAQAKAQAKAQKDYFKQHGQSPNHH